MLTGKIKCFGSGAEFGESDDWRERERREDTVYAEKKKKEMRINEKGDN